MSPISLTLGTLVTRWLVGYWLRDSSAAGPADDLISFVRDSLGNTSDARAASRQFDQLAEKIADKLDPFIQGEFGGTDSADRNAAAICASSSLTKAIDSGLDIVSLNLDPTAIEQAVRRIDANAARRAHLGSDGTELYNLLITECCHYLAATASQLPEFVNQATLELLVRGQKIIALGEQVLDRLPPALPESWGRGSQDDIFAARFLKDVVHRYDQLQLFGVRDTGVRPTYSLSTAFVSLSSSVPKGSGLQRSRILEDPDSLELLFEDDKHPEPQADSLRVESALRGHRKLVLAGDAGSGKSTLLQWIAVSASQNSFNSELADWNGLLPFVLPLRRYSRGDMPSPEEFIANHHPTIAGIMPAGWVHRVMAEGRALVLIDGLDELPEDQRTVARSWLDNLIANFPDNTYLITARPLALSHEWRSLPNFRHAELLPMQRAEVRSFVEHWHRASAKNASTDETRAHIEAAERSLLATLAQLPAIRSLCTSPLLCALICALHQQSANRLPETRMELYETALQMLVTSRDEERKVEAPADYRRLTHAEKKALLSDFALWLHENGAADAEEGIYFSRIERKVSSLTRVDPSAAPMLAEQLLLRSGVLRRPVEERVDFVHRTFLEYLAAAQLVDEDAIGKLLSHAHLDYWREVVVMAAGHLGANRRAQFLSSLVRRGQEEPANRHRLYLLAVACLETSPVLDPDMQTTLDHCLDEVVPPTNMTDAAAVASAGALAVPRLGKQANGRLARNAVACVRSLSLIGTDDALEQLKTYSNETRVTVARELMKAWGNFDPEVFAREVLSKSMLNHGSIVISRPEYVPHLRHLENLKSAFLDLPGRIDSLRELDRSPVVTKLNISRARSIARLRGLGDLFPNLATLWLEGCEGLTDLEGIEECSQLRTAYLDDNQGVVDVRPLANLTSLTKLHLYNTGVSGVSGLNGLDFEELRLGGQWLSFFEPVVRAKRLMLLYVNGVDLTAGLDFARPEVLHLVTYDGGVRASIPDSVLYLTAYGGRDSIEWIGAGENVLHVKTSSTALQQLPELPNAIGAEVSYYSQADLQHSPTDLLDGRFPNLRSIRIYGSHLEDLSIPGFEVRRRSGSWQSSHIVDLLRADRSSE